MIIEFITFFFRIQFIFPERTASSISGDEPAKKEAKVEVSLLDGKRSHNIAILISRVKMSFQEIREALLKLDEDKLTEQMIVQFLETVPSPEELALLSDFPEEEKIKLGVAEQFLAEVWFFLHSLLETFFEQFYFLFYFLFSFVNVDD